MRLSLAALLFCLPAAAAVLPDAIGPFHRTATSAPAVSDRALWDEYGLKASETASYESDGAKFSLTAWRLQDSTGAMAAFEWQRPAKSVASNAAAWAVEAKDYLLVLHGNYVLEFKGYQPQPAELEALYAALLNVDTTSLPVLTGYLPAHDLVPNSQRYVTGPVALQKFDSGIPPSVAAFHYGAEAQIGAFQSPKGDLTLAIFNYPTNQIAMQRIAEFEKLPGAMAKRSGPLIAVILAPPDPDFAERLLAGVRYQAEVTRDERVPTRHDNIGFLLVDIFVFTGILVGFSIVAGLAFGSVRAFLRRGKSGAEAEPMITLHLEER